MAIFGKSDKLKEQTVLFSDKKRSLKDPYKSVRHIAIFTEEETAISVAKRLNYSVYFPIGLSKEEMKTLFDDDRSKYGVEKEGDNYHVIERLVY